MKKNIEKPVVLLLAHGSREEETLQDIKELAARLSLGLGKAGKLKDVAAVDFAFLEISQPPLESRVHQWVERGTVKFIVIPLFVFSGKHLLEQVPLRLKMLGKELPRVEFELTQHITRLGGFEQLLLDAI